MWRWPSTRRSWRGWTRRVCARSTRSASRSSSPPPPERCPPLLPGTPSRVPHKAAGERLSLLKLPAEPSARKVPTQYEWRAPHKSARECLSLLKLPAEPRAQRSLLDTSGVLLLDHSSRVLQGNAGDCLSLLGSQQNLQPKGCPQLTQQGVRHRPSGHVLANQVPAGSMHA